jgi:acyl-CoA synthetase (NDP forming)
MSTPKWLTPQEVIAENLAWLRQIAKDALEYNLVKLNADLRGIADEVEESMTELAKKMEAHKTSEELLRQVRDAVEKELHQ